MKRDLDLRQEIGAGAESGVSRRMLLLGAGLAAAAMAVPVCAGTAAGINAATTPEARLRLLLRLMATSGHAVVPWFYTGRIYAVLPGAAPVHLCNFEGSEIYWIKPLSPNAWSMAVSTLTFYRDRVSGGYLERFYNPLNGNTVEVTANVLRSKPGQGAVYADQSMTAMGETQPITMELHRNSDLIWLTTSRSNARAQQPSMEVNTLFGAAADVDNLRQSSPRAHFGSVSLSHWSKWLQMEEAQGHLLWHAAGRKLQSLDQLPSSYRSRAESLKSPHFSDPEDDPVVTAAARPSSTIDSAAAAAAAAPAASPAAAQALRFSYVAGAGGVPLSVAESGESGAPGILLIHGLGQSHLSFARQFRSALGGRFHLVAFDLRGHGNSGKPWDPAAYSESRGYADDVAKVIAATGLRQTLIVAWSYGTLVTADYIRHHGAEQLAGVVMIGALGGLASLPPSAFDPKVMAAMQQLRELGASPGLENTLKASHDVVPLLTKRPMPREWTATSETVNALVPPFARTAMGARMSINNADLIARIDVPMLLAAGSEDKGTPESLMQSLAARLSQASVKVYEGCGHSPFAEDSERFNQDLTEFADRVFAAGHAGGRA